MVERKTLVADTETDFEFENVSNEFIVKNFTSGYILVCPDEFDEDKAYKIPTMTAQKIKANTDTMVVKSAAAGEVEIDA